MNLSKETETIKKKQVDVLEMKSKISKLENSPRLPCWLREKASAMSLIAWWATIYGVTKNWTPLSDFHFGKMPSARGATKFVHNYRTCPLEPGNCKYQSPRMLEPGLRVERSRLSKEPTRHSRSSPHLPELEESAHISEDPAQPINKINNYVVWKSRKFTKGIQQQISDNRRNNQRTWRQSVEKPNKCFWKERKMTH